MACSSHPVKYQVFLSFRGEDTRLNFTSHLLKALKDKGMNVFFDEEKLEKGEQLSLALSQAIAASNLSIIVLSVDYASSKSCLAELSDIMARKSSHGQIVLPIFFHVDPSHVRNIGGSFKTSFEDHESNRPLDEVKRWKDAFAEAGKLKGWHIEGGKFDRSETEYIKDIVESVTEKLMSRQSRSAHEELVGINHQKKMVLGLIEQKDSRVIGLWGMGGIGKTTLADAVYEEVSTKFEDGYFLQNVREKIKKQGRESIRNELLCKLLDEKEIHIDTPSIGYHFRKRLNNKKVIVVLDDVSDSDQIDFMGVRHFGDGSKIIVTSRDKQVLKNGGADKIHEVKKLNEKESLRLFSTFAFKKLNHVADFLHLSDKFVRYADGSPLALKVLGSKLYTKSREEWESELDRLKQYGEPKLSHILKSSFDGLDELEKDIFLDIACFFNREFMEEIHIDSYYKGAMSGINSLIDKCLLNVDSYNWISMHDMLEEMGKNIVRQESKDPGKRSRLWNSNDVYQVLKNNKGTHLIEGIKVDMSQIDNLLLSSLFENMFNLRYIHCYVPVHSWSYWCNKPPANGVSILSLPNELRYLRWEYYPFKSLPPSFNPKNLVVLKLNYGKMKRLWNEDNYKDIVNLRVIDVSDSENLKKIPSLVGAINLKSLNCSDCESLVELPRLAHLTSLEELRFRGCYNLTKFPELPDILSELDLSDTKIEEVPDSIQHLLRLELLCFRNCPIVKFPKIPRSIKLLDFSGTQIEEVSSSLDPLSKLEYLDMSFTLVQNVGSNILKLEYLKSLDLSYCPIVQFPEIEVPSPILTFKRLEYLTMVGCQSLELLSELPPDLKDLNAHGCTSLEDVSFTHQNLNSFDGEGYFFMIFWNCFNLNQYSISNIEANAMLKIQSLAEKCASRYDQEFSPKWEPKLICCFPGNKISANRFEYQSMNSFLSLEIAPSVNGVSRFLVFAICLVVDLTDCHCMADVEFICEYQLATASGFEKFRCELSPKPIHWPEQEGMGDHVLILCGKDMVRQDKNYVKASFEFRIKNREVERCGVHVFYVDAESYKITDVMRCDESNQNFDSQEDADIGGDEGDRGSKRLKNFHLEDATSR